jgi:predicted TPR repeat methyltransferase
MNNHTIPAAPKAAIISALPASIQHIITSLEKMQTFSPSLVRNIVMEANVTAEELSTYERYDHVPCDSYGRTMVYDGGYFEIMVMSWQPGDMSGIHDHGHTQWGAVQVFGNAEHAAFMIMDDEITTLSRVTMKSGQVVAVGHQLVHQMGNGGAEDKYISLHVYGNYDRTEGITEDARIFDFSEGSIQFNDGGAFFALPETAVKRREPVPAPDFSTWLRHQTELIKRINRCTPEHPYKGTHDLDKLSAQLFDKENHAAFMEAVVLNLDEQGHTTDSNHWKILNWELKDAAAMQQNLLSQENTSDNFSNYAAVYDEVIGKPCLSSFMADYLRFFAKQYDVNLSASTVLSIGCGTGLVERFIIDEMGVQQSNLLGIDFSEAMVKVASESINAEWGDALHLDPAVQTWDLAYCGLNVLQYLGHEAIEEAVQRVSAVVNDGGYFVGDFITPDHIRTYSNVQFSEDGKILSLRTPKLVEIDNYIYQRSEIINVNCSGDKMRITHEGEHDRFLPALSRVRAYFEESFGQVDIYDAISLQAIEKGRDTCASTRYLVVAKK